MRFSGKVVRKMFGEGSKSEHNAVMLVGKDREWVLRRSDGNPFCDPSLDALVGKRIIVTGSAHEHTLIMDSWVEDNEGYKSFTGKLQGLRLLADVIKEEPGGDNTLLDFSQVLGDICAELRDTYKQDIS